MTLQDFMKRRKITDTQAGEALGVDAYSVRRYREKGRVPAQALVHKIVKWSKGRVMPNDLYGYSGKAHG